MVFASPPDQRGQRSHDTYPGLPTLIGYSYRLSGDLAVVEITLDYEGNRINVCEIVELQDGKIKRDGGYFVAPEWRAQWVERM